MAPLDNVPPAATIGPSRGRRGAPGPSQGKRLRYRSYHLICLIASACLAVPAAAHADAQADALAVSKQALEAYLDGQFGLAADLYDRAYQRWPAETLYLYNAARAAQRAGRLEAAAHKYRAYLLKAPGTAPEVAKARVHLAEVDAARTAAAAAARKQTPARAPPAGVATAAAPSPAPSIALAVVGGLGVVAGGVLLGLAAQDQAALDRQLATVDASGRIVGIGHDAATSEQAAINRSIYGGWAALGLGAGAVGLAVALWPRPAAAPAPRVTLWPRGRGAVASIRF